MSTPKHDRFEPIAPLGPVSDAELAQMAEDATFWQRPDVLVLLARRDAEDVERAKASRQAEAEAGE